MNNKNNESQTKSKSARLKYAISLSFGEDADIVISRNMNKPLIWYFGKISIRDPTKRPD